MALTRDSTLAIQSVIHEIWWIEDHPLSPCLFLAIQHIDNFLHEETRVYKSH